MKTGTFEDCRSAQYTIFVRTFLVRLMLGLATLVVTPLLTAQTFTTLHSFNGSSDGGSPDVAGAVPPTTLYGAAESGGANGEGSIFAVNADGTGFRLLYSFSYSGASDGKNPRSALVVSGDIIYGTAEFGGKSGNGTIFRINTDGTGFTNLYNFTGGSDGASPYAGLISSGNTLYGTAAYSANGNRGTVFKINTDGSGFQVLHNFSALTQGTNSDGAEPVAPLVISGSALFGTAQFGGATGAGTVFRVNVDGSSFTNLYSFTGGADSPYAGLILSGNSLYGTTTYGGSNDAGSVFAINTDGTDFRTLHNFTGGGYGAQPDASLVLSGNTLFGTDSEGGSNDLGEIFSVNIDGTDFKSIYSFTGSSDGSIPLAGLTLFGNTLFGTASAGGYGDGTVFAIKTDGTGFTNLYEFTGYVDGSSPMGGVALAGDMLYGSSSVGIFLATTNGYGFTTISNSSLGNAHVILSGNTFYGTTPFGGSVFKVNRDGSGLAILHSFTNATDGSLLFGGVVLSSNILYGMANFGGLNNNGTVFKVNIDGTGFKLLHTFSALPNSDGARPSGGLVVSGNLLFGTASDGGSGNGGTIFSLNTDGSGFTALHSFSGADGIEPSASLTLSGNTLYGTAFQGGSFGDGTVFSVDTNGIGFEILHAFSSRNGSAINVDGYGSETPLALYGRTLYGATSVGGTAGSGTIFAINTDGTGFAVLHEFTEGSSTGTNYDGTSPNGVAIGSDGALYGSAMNGGTYGDGTLFQILWTPQSGGQLNGLSYTWTTLAGSAGSGSADGVGDEARFEGPSGIAVDSNGNVYVADTLNDTIRKITPPGVVSTLAGLAGAAGSADGTGSTARFNSPYGVTVDNNGNVYVADSGNDTIRRITPDGAVSTLAGLAGNSGSADGTGGQARFNFPYGVAVDPNGNVYVGDSSNDTIRKISPSGVVVTLAGLAGSSGSADGTGGNARFNSPYGVAVDMTGNIYVADSSNDTIRKISPAGVVVTLAGLAGSSGSGDGTGSSARFYFPSGVAVDIYGNIYVADTLNYTIREISAAGVVSTIAGTPGSSGSADGTGSGARFNSPNGVAVDETGNVYVADRNNSTIRQVTSAGVVSTIAGPAGSAGSADGTGADARFSSPSGVAVDNDGNVYVADQWNYTVRKITSAGVVSTLAGLAGTSGSADGAGSNARFDFPNGVAVDSAGNIYVSDAGNDTIRKITPAGVVSTLAGLAGNAGSADGIGSNGRFNLPEGMAVDSSGNVYVADTGNDTIRKISPAGAVTTLAGLAGNSGSADGAGSAARFNNPEGVAVDKAGNVYVADSDNRVIREISPGGFVSTLAGTAGLYGWADGLSFNARFRFPIGIAVDGNDNLYIGDAENDLIRGITPAGVVGAVTTLGGQVGEFGSTDGTGSNARFAFPAGVAVDRAGNVYVADFNNNTIRKGIFSAYESMNSVAYNASAPGSSLTVTLLPPQANGMWRLPWELTWHNSGDTESNLVAGNYTIEFESQPGWLAIPPSLTLAVTGATAITNEYYPTLAVEGTNDSGTLTVTLGPNPPSGAAWGFLGDGSPAFPSGYTTNLAAGTYLIDFAAISGRVTPPNLAVQVQAGQPTYLAETYLLSQQTPNGIYLPFLVPPDEITDTVDYPFGFDGQLDTDVGYGSGVAVQANVVLTAAHLVFNDQTLSYVSQAYWFYQEEAGISEPQPVPARGWYVLSGYAEQRTNDLQVYSPDTSTPQSRNLDVAALYFLSPVAQGGYSGYLPSDGSPNPWLTSTANKMLVGYPVDGSQFDVSVTPGEMYQTDPQPYPLALASDPVPDQQVYTASWFLSYPGNSGGPLYVELNGYYYPAGVYLGTLYNGATPYASAVRAIDGDVVSLITNAASLGDTGTNNTGGGVITIVPNQAVSASNPGYLEIQLGPPSAVLAGAGWRLQGDPAYSTATNYVRMISSTNVFVVQFEPVSGWNAPPNQTVSVFPGPPATLSAFYTVTNPVMLANVSRGIGISGTAGTAYEIESRSSLRSGNWTPVSTNTIVTNGFNPVLPRSGTNAAIYYRAIWLGR